EVTGVLSGFSDQDVVQASRALSGWSVQNNQRIDSRTVAPSTGEFFYNPAQHNNNATSVLGVSIANQTAPMTQGRAFLNLIAYHPATAAFVSTKLAKRIFGDTPPDAVVARATAAWIKYQYAPDQIGRVLRAIVLDGEEIWSAPTTKI